jgi:hypothetical protein
LVYVIVKWIVAVVRDQVTRRQRALDVRRSKCREECTVLGAEAIELLANGQSDIANDRNFFVVDNEPVFRGVNVCSLWRSTCGPFLEKFGGTERAEAGIGAESVLKRESARVSHRSQARVTTHIAGVAEGDALARVGEASGWEEVLQRDNVSHSLNASKLKVTSWKVGAGAARTAAGVRTLNATMTL